MKLNINGKKSSNNTLTGVLIGIIFFLGSFVLLWWNEGNYVKNIKIADFTKKNVVSITSKNYSNNGNLIHFTSNVKTQDIVKDEFVKLRVVVLSRLVEMYQWDEHKDGDGNIQYDKVWSEFHKTTGDSHRNPDFPYKSNKYYANNVDFGDFKLSSDVIYYLSPTRELSSLPNSHGYYGNGNYLYSSPKAYNDPQIGDVRISYKYLPSNAMVSIIAGQNGDVLEPYVSKVGNIVMVENGSLTASEVIANFEKNNIITTFIFRFTGFTLMAIGLILIVSPISKLFSYIGLGGFVERITNFISFLVALILSLITISLAWLAYRPIISITLLIISGLIAYLVFSINKTESK